MRVAVVEDEQAHFELLSHYINKGVKVVISHYISAESFLFQWDEERKEKYSFCWGFALGDSFNYKNGKDVRIYDGYNLAKRWTADKIYGKAFRKDVKEGCKGEAGSSFFYDVIIGAIDGISYMIVVIPALAGAISIGSNIKFAGFGEKLKDMEAGINTYINKDFDDSGVEISGGEAQKIAIARAIYKEAPFVLLDEPTAALDPISEYEIYSAFDEIVGTKTAIYISHRLSSCRFCEKIAVLHEGKLIQFGNHDELLRDEDGKYYEMWNAQAQYYRENQVG